MKEITVKELKEKMEKKEDITIIDVRMDVERTISKIEPSLHIEMNHVPNQLENLDKKKPYAILCRSGARSANVTNFLEQNGFEFVYNVRGGILEWADKIDKTMQKY